MNLISQFKKLHLIHLELTLFFLMLLSLPSFEAPKNIFLVGVGGLSSFKIEILLSLKYFSDWK